METIRAVAPVRVNQRRPARKCKCGETTNHGKPACIKHLEEIPYARRLMREVEAHALECETYRVDPNGLAAREMIAMLGVHGRLTIKRLAIMLVTSEAHAELVAKKLLGMGLVRYGAIKQGTRTRRIAETVELV